MKCSFDPELRTSGSDNIILINPFSRRMCHNGKRLRVFNSRQTERVMRKKKSEILRVIWHSSSELDDLQMNILLNLHIHSID